VPHNNHSIIDHCKVPGEAYSKNEESNQLTSGIRSPFVRVPHPFRSLTKREYPLPAGVPVEMNGKGQGPTPTARKNNIDRAFLEIKAHTC